MTAAGLIIFSGFAWGCKMTIPYAIVARVYGGQGSHIAVLNTSLYLTQVSRSHLSHTSSLHLTQVR